jgi:sugar phosphate isomerase/epimerase
LLQSRKRENNPQMKLSLSVRIAESPKRKDVAAVPVETVAACAKSAGFDGLSMRASVVGIDSAPSRVREVRTLLDDLDLQVSMVTGDLALAINNADATRPLTNIAPYLDLTEALDCDLVRVMMHHEDDIADAHRAADAAAERGIRLSHQMHWGSLFETVDGALDILARVNRRNFGVTYEPANMLACGEEYGPATIERLSPYLFNVYYQNIRLDPTSQTIFATRRQGAVPVRFLPLGDLSGIDPVPVINALGRVGYDGWFSIHQPLIGDASVEAAIAAAAAEFLPLM